MPAPVLPSPRTWTALDQVTAPRLRADVSDAVALLGYPPLFTGSQQGSAQSIPNNTTTPVLLDTETLDNYGGHSLLASTDKYFAQLTGWYLCETVLPLAYTGGAGGIFALIGGVQNNGAATFYGGNRLPNPAGHQSAPVACKLMQCAVTGTDYMSCAISHNAGAAQNTAVSAAGYPYFSARWVAALSGTQPLPVPPLTTAPSPITAAWLNANIRDTINFLIYPPVMEYTYNAGTATLASAAAIPATGTTIALDTATVDNYSAFNTGTSTWTAPVAGTYLAWGQLAVTTLATALAAAAGLTITSANYNGGTTFTLWGGATQAVISANQVTATRRRLRLNAGDTIKLAGWQRDSAAAANTIPGGVAAQPRLIIIWQGL